MAAAQGRKLKSRRKCEKPEGGRGDPVQETWRLRQQEEARVRGRARRGELEFAAVKRERGEGRAKEGERDPKKEARRSLRPSAVWRGTFISRTLRKADGWWKTGERRLRRGGHRPSRTASDGGALAPDAPARRPRAPERAPALPSPARAGRWHEIGCSRNESAPSGGG